LKQISVPSVIRYDKNFIIYEYILGYPLIELIEKHHSSILNYFELLGRNLRILNHTHHISLHDCNLRNFIIKENENILYFIDFEESQKLKENNIYSDYYRVCAHLLCLDNGLLDESPKIDDSIEECLIAFTDGYFNEGKNHAEIMLDYFSLLNEIKFLASRRQHQFNEEIAKNLLKSSKFVATFSFLIS
jgi:tRNA A-37 threonylcarbamoyl transferase component Bud32